MSQEFDAVAKGHETLGKFRKSNWTLALLAGLISNTCIDTGTKLEKLDDQPLQSVYIVTDIAMSVGTALSLQTPDGKRRITLSNKSQKEPFTPNAQESLISLTSQQEVNL